jgi:RNA polymerase sigma factor (sigma-70 family)
MDDWMEELRRGNSEDAWDLFIARYRRVIFSAIRRYARDPDDVMDIFARVCEALRDNDLYRLRRYAERHDHTARVSTWLVTVVSHLTIDWLRHRDGRRHESLVAASLSPLRRRIFELVYVQGRSHVEAYEVIRGTVGPHLTFRQFLAEVRATRDDVSAAGHGHVLREMREPAADTPTTQAPISGETGQRRAMLADIVRWLSTGERRAVDLYVVDEKPAATVASMLGLPNAKAVYNRVYRALEILRQRLEKAGIRRGDL